jgi:signal transduction histidine kinase
MNKSMLHRLITNQLLVVVLFAALTTTHVLWQLFRAGAGEYDQHMRGTALTLLQVAEPLRDKPEQMLHDLTLVSQSVRQLFAMEKSKQPLGSTDYQLIVRLMNAQGQTLFQSPPTSHLQLPAASLNADNLGFELNQQRWRSRVLRSPSGQLTIQLAETESGADNDAADIVWRFIVIPTLVFLPFAALLTWFSSRRGLSPLSDLAQLIATRTPNDLRALGPVTIYAETAPVVMEINALLERLRTTLAREREFLADAAHELRTPLAVVQAQAHVLHHAASEADKNKAAAELDLGVGRAAALINKLLLSARVNGEDFAPRLEWVDLNAFVQERVALLSSLAASKRIEMELNVAVKVQVHIDRESFMSAVDNVIDNAIRYTPAGGCIVIHIEQGPGTLVSLRVADNGVGIPRELHERVFERFFRVNGTEQLGSGLGLAIVKRVLALHGGDVKLSSGLHQRGLMVDLTWPGATQAAAAR